MRALWALSKQVQEEAQLALLQAPKGTSELDLHMIRRQVADVVSGIDRACYWVGKSYGLIVEKED